jgi:hypothetical protein
MICHCEKDFNVKWVCRDKNAVESQKCVITEIATCQTQILNVAIREKIKDVVDQFIGEFLKYRGFVVGCDHDEDL